MRGTGQEALQSPGRSGVDIRPGLSYLWVLNDEWDRPALERMLDGFDNRGVSAVCLHPRAGLLVPYGGDEWHELIAWIIEQCAERGMDVWLYDEDPYPSGSFGGRLVAENPVWQAHAIVQHEAEAALKPGELFYFPSGKLLWCGLVDPQTGQTRDLTSRAGVVRRKWVELPEWDSRFYYPDTPLYDCPRAWTIGLEYAVRMPEDRGAERLVAYIADPISEEHSAWGHMPDLLNPECTQAFLESTHGRYKQTVGEHFGGCIKAIFTDEPHVPASRPWTPGMFESFTERYGYDLRPRLWHLFETGEGRPEVMNSRIHLREWMGKRFEESWVAPVSRWCEQNNLPLIGHISPEDDPVEQVNTVGNLLPLMKKFAIPGIDLIIPAVGDGRHPLLNVGIISARSVAEQQDRQGVLSETLACSGTEPDAEIANRVFRWQTLMGLTAPVVHAAYTSMRDQRAIDAPPDWGPTGGAWSEMLELGVALSPMQERLAGARQVAPVAMLWPIRSFMAREFAGYQTECEHRRAFADLIGMCMDHQVGLHLLDEADLWEATLEDGLLGLGRARYSHIIVPGATVWHERTHQALKRVSTGGIDVRGVGSPASWVQTDSGLEPVDVSPWRALAQETASVADLPRLLRVEGDGGGADLRCTSWFVGDAGFDLLMNVRQADANLTLDDQQVTLKPDTVYLREGSGDFQAFC